MALDAGTTSNRAILFDKRGQIISVAQKEFTQIFPQPGWVEHDANEIWSTMLGVAVEAMMKAGATAEDITAIGITNQRETTIVWDKETGEPVYNAIVWQCRRTSKYCDSLKEEGLLLSHKAEMDPGKCTGCPGAGGEGRTAFRNRGYLAYLEADPGPGACDGLFQRIPYYDVQYHGVKVGPGDPGEAECSGDYASGGASLQ